MADPELARGHARGGAVDRAHDRLRDIIPTGLTDGQLVRLTDVLAQVWDDGYGHGRDDEAGGALTGAASDEDRIRDAMAEAQEHPGRVVTR